MCDRPSTSREHVPPQSFFPIGRRGNLWTVPSCADHNSGNSKDVEYVRNIISVQRGTNMSAEQTFEVAKRSWNRSPGLFHQTFDDVRAVVIEGEEAGLFSFDLPRVKAVMSAVVHALAFRDFGRAYIGEWNVFCATLLSKTQAPEWDKFRGMLFSVTFEPLRAAQPDVFAYGIHRMDFGFIYRLVFYDAFVVFAWPVVKGCGRVY
jgi:hypothetical protein